MSPLIITSRQRRWPNVRQWRPPDSCSCQCRFCSRRTRSTAYHWLANTTLGFGCRMHSPVGQRDGPKQPRCVAACCPSTARLAAQQKAWILVRPEWGWLMQMDERCQTVVLRQIECQIINLSGRLDYYLYCCQEVRWLSNVNYLI